MMRRTRWLTVGIVTATTLLMLGISAREFSRARSFQLVGDLVHRVETDRRIVALTFDDGPTLRAIDELLPVLDSYGVKATFFLVGETLERDMSLGRRISANGHELGNHSYSHQRMIFRSFCFIEKEIERTDALIRATGYEGPIYFRPPYGHKLVVLPLYLARSERTTITWDIEPDSFPDIANDPDHIARFVSERVQPGSIILLHPMFRSGEASLAAVPKLIESLTSRAYSFVTVSELLADAA